MNVYQIGFMIMIIVSIVVSLYIKYKNYERPFSEILVSVILTELVIVAFVIIFFMLGEV